MNNRTATVKVGLLTTISLIVLITTVIWLRGRALGGGQTYDVYFKDVDGLKEGAPVQFMGIRVGFVDDVKPLGSGPHRFHVLVRFTVTDREAKVPRGSTISLEQSGLIGEKFVEITPPRSQSVDLVLSHPDNTLRPGIPIKVVFRNGPQIVGSVSNVKVSEIKKLVSSVPDYRYQIHYLIDQPGYLPPSNREFSVKHLPNHQAYLVLEDDNAYFLPKPSREAYFSLEEPLRLKIFLEEQLASAESLKMTNDKINQLLSDETISTIQETVKNSDRLTAQAADTLKAANRLFSSTSEDLKSLMASTQDLSKSLLTVSNNVNDLVGDPKFKTDLRQTLAQMQQSTASLSALLNDPNLKAILSESKVTSQNASELMAYLKKTAVDDDLQGRFNQSLNLLNDSLQKLSSVLSDVKTVSQDKESVRQIIEQTKETSQNLNHFSQKLNKRFALFRMLF